MASMIDVFPGTSWAGDGTQDETRKIEGDPFPRAGEPFHGRADHLLVEIPGDAFGRLSLVASGSEFSSTKLDTSGRPC